jgi:LPXTG-motif cell wall-anchored protein
LDYTNSYGYEFDEESDIPKVYTCGIHIFKYDAKTGAPLQGAEFKLAKEAVTDEEKAAAVKLVVGKSDAKDVVYVEFFATEEMSGEKVNVVTTPVDGKAVMYGLEEGTYYLVEIKAPAGYNLLSYPVAVTLNEQSHQVDDPATEEVEPDMTVKVANSNTFVLPETGGIGTVIFTVSGGLMTLAGGAILTLKKREEE